eukprot:7867686-Pyramimonas_sp.AAC.1
MAPRASERARRDPPPLRGLPRLAQKLTRRRNSGGPPSHPTARTRHQPSRSPTGRPWRACQSRSP